MKKDLQKLYLNFTDGNVNVNAQFSEGMTLLPTRKLSELGNKIKPKITDEHPSSAWSRYVEGFNDCRVQFLKAIEKGINSLKNV